jgi:hypothetical protein
MRLSKNGDRSSRKTQYATFSISSSGFSRLNCAHRHGPDSPVYSRLRRKPRHQRDSLKSGCMPPNMMPYRSSQKSCQSCSWYWASDLATARRARITLLGALGSMGSASSRAGVEKRPSSELVFRQSNLIVAGPVHASEAGFEERGGDVPIVPGEIHDQMSRRIVDGRARMADGKPRGHIAPEEHSRRRVERQCGADGRRASKSLGFKTASRHCDSGWAMRAVDYQVGVRVTVGVTLQWQ